MLPLCAHFILQKPQGYDYFLGGKDRFDADRTASEAMLKIYPYTGFSARANRAFLGRAALRG
jgi:hypothetical protein